MVPAAGAYRELNVFGSQTGRVACLNAGDTFPGQYVGFHLATLNRKVSGITGPRRPTQDCENSDDRYTLKVVARWK